MNRISELVLLLEKANDAYYNDADSDLTDAEYDQLKDELRKLDSKHPLLSQVGTKTKVNEWKKAKHKISMTSLNKVNLTDEFRKWSNDVGCKYFIIEDKLDGGSADLEYEDGKLVRGITRGDGFEGDAITSNVIKMQNVKTKLENFDGSLRGEIVLLVEDFEKINKILVSEGTKPLANPRNAAVGLSKRFDGRFSEYITILYYDIAGIDFNSEFEKMEYIKNTLKLRTSFYKRVNVEEAIDVYNQYVDKLRAELKFDVDGLVVKCDDISIQKKLGEVGGCPRSQIAWKFPPITKISKVTDIKWNVGNMRRLTPVIHIEPTRIGGVTVSKMNCHNIDIFMKFKLWKGCKLKFKRANDVIPVPLEVIESEFQSEKCFQPPKHCPICNAELEIDGKFLICPNDNCEALITGNLERWISGLDIMDIGGKIIEALHRAGKINEPADFYKLSISDIANLEGLGEKSAKKILEHLHEKKELTLSEFIGNLNMHNFSTSRVELLVEAGFDSIEKLQNAKVENLVKVKGIESKTANKIVNGLISKKQVIDNLLKVGIKIKAIQKVQAKSNKLNFSFCFTGGVNRVDSNGNRYTRGMMEDLVRENGGRIDSVKRGLNFLVQADPSSQSSKTKKALELGINILSEADFFKMLGM